MLFFFWQTIFAAVFTTPFSTAANYTMDSEIEVVGGLAKIKQSSLWSGLQGYWKMDDIAGQIVDSSGNGNNLVNHNASYGSVGKLNNALTFVENDYLQGSGSMMNMGLGDMTISSWFKTTDAGGILVAKSFYSGQDERYALYFSSGQLRIMFDGGAANKITGVPSGPYLDDQWHQAIAVFDRDGDMSLYIDGVFKSSIDISAYSAIDFDKNNVFLIGRYNDVSGSGVHATYNGKFSGEIDETAVWNRALLPAEISELYNAGNGKEVTQYESGVFSITKNGGDTGTISIFNNFVVTGGVVGGSLAYQLSEDGITWKYWDGAAWVNAGATDYNTEAGINTNISTFPTTANKIYVKSFLTSNGMQAVEIDNININYDTNSSPTNIQIDGGNTDNVNEGTISGTSIATITTTDIDVGDSHTYTLVAGVGDEDNAKFQISGSNLQLAFTPDFENPTDLGDTAGNNTYSIRIQTDDGHGGTYQKSFIISIIDLDENIPVISLLGSPVVNLNIGEVYLDAGATATDDVDGDITANIIVNNPVNTNVAGDYPVTYNVDDSAGNSAVEVIRHVIVSSGQTGRSRPKSFKKKKVCKDPKALNYKKKGLHRQSLCKYKTSDKNSDDVKKELQKQIDHLLKLLKDKQETQSGKSCEIFRKKLKRGDRGGEVKKVQNFLRKKGYFKYQKDTGYFGSITEQAVKDFQSKYSDKILKPLGLVSPTGNWFKYTKKQANSMLGCDL